MSQYIQDPLMIYTQSTCLLVVMPVLHTLNKCSLGDNFAGPFKESKPLAACFCRGSATTCTEKESDQAEDCSGRLERVMTLLSRWDDLFPRAESGTCLRFSASLYTKILSFDAASAANTVNTDQYTRVSRYVYRYHNIKYAIMIFKRANFRLLQGYLSFDYLQS